MAKKKIEIKRPGLLHKILGIGKNKKIPAEKIVADKAKAKKSGNAAQVKRDTFAINAKKWNHKGKK